MKFSSVPINSTKKKNSWFSITHLTLSSSPIDSTKQILHFEAVFFVPSPTAWVFEGMKGVVKTEYSKYDRDNE